MAVGLNYDVHQENKSQILGGIVIQGGGKEKITDLQNCVVTSAINTYQTKERQRDGLKLPLSFKLFSLCNLVYFSFCLLSVFPSFSLFFPPFLMSTNVFFVFILSLFYCFFRAAHRKRRTLNIEGEKSKFIQYFQSIPVKLLRFLLLYCL